MSLRVLVIGYGEMGHAMEYLLGDRSDLSVWTRRPVEGREPVELASATAAADVVLYCIPVTPLEDLAGQVFPHLKAGSISLSIAKGLDEKGRPASEALRAVYGTSHDYGVLYGPMISEEIRAGRPAYAQLAMWNAEIPETVKRLFSRTGLVIEPSMDITGISWASVLKNIYAILFGASDELGLGDNVRGALSVACLCEMELLVEQVDGDSSSVHGLAGLGDLVTTATSEDSHHHAIGRKLARGETDEIAGEGVHTLSMLARHSLLDESASPLLRFTRDIIDAPVDIGARLVGQLESITNSRFVR